MSIKSAFIKPPEIFRGKYSQVAEVARDVLTAQEMATFEYAVSSYQFVNNGARVSGAQWLTNVGRQYDLAEPRNADVARVIKKGMLVDEFADWKIVYQIGQNIADERGKPVFIGSLPDVDNFLTVQTKKSQVGFRLVPIAHPDRDSDFSDAQRGRLEFDLKGIEPTAQVIGGQPALGLLPTYKIYPAQLFGLQHENARVTFKGNDEHLLSRVAQFAQLPPVGKQQTPEALADDREAEFTLLTLLANHGGYSVWLRGATSAESGHRSHVAEKADGDKVPNFATPADIECNAELFMRNADAAGWTPADSTVFLARPTAAVQSLQGNRPFESVIHQNFIGYRLTPELTTELYSRVHRPQETDLDIQEQRP